MLDTGYFRTVFNRLRTASRLDTLTQRVDTMVKNEARREAEWLDVLDRFDRLYKRIVARLDREAKPGAERRETGVPGEARSDSGESTLELKRRLRG